MDKPNQWEVEGDCQKCRRQHYCRRPCRLRMRYQDKLMSQKMTELFAEELLMSGHSELIDKKLKEDTK